jgi:hypothetical protein
MTHERFLEESAPTRDARVEQVCRVEGGRGLVAVIVESGLVGPLATSLGTYVADLQNEGHAVSLVGWSGGTPVDLRDSLRAWHAQGLVGAVLVGELPVPWYELSYDQSEFPCDYYYMELDGQWSDSDGDGLFNSLSAGGGDEGPEIWIGRLWAMRLSWGAPVSLLQDYFSRNHAFRTAGTGIPQRALSFVDDDWDYWGDCSLDLAFNQVTVINASAQTIAANYKAELLEGYQWVHVCSHSCPWSHTFYLNYGWGGGSVYNYEILALQPPALFYNLFSCSATRYVERDNLGEWYIFGQPHGLAVVGSAKTGSMLDFHEFYGPLGQGASIGDAYRQWFAYEAQGGLSGYEQSWFMGMNILGDPTLRIPSRSASDGNGSPQPPLDGRGVWALSAPHSGTFTDARPQLIPGQGVLWLVWESGRDVRSMIYSSWNTGSGWSSPERVWNHQYWDLHPAGALDSTGGLWAAWQSYDYGWGAMNIRLANRGLAGWSQPLTVTAGPAYQVEPALVCDPGGVWTSWSGWVGARSEVFARYYDGSSFGPTENVSGGLGENIDPCLTRDGTGRIWLSWASDRSGEWQIEVRSHSSGTWWPVQHVTTGTGEKRNPCLVWSPTEGLWALWQSSSGAETQVYAARRMASGLWTSPTCLSANRSLSYSPAASVDPATGDVWVCWVTQEGAGTSVRVSCLAGGDWSTPEPVSLPAGWALVPTTAVYEGEAWVGWGQGDTGAWDVWLARSPADRVPPASISDLSARLAGPDLMLQWSPVTSDTLGRVESIAEYLVYRGDHAWFASSASTLIGQVPNPPFYDQGAAGSGTPGYFYVVQAVDVAGNASDDSNQEAQWSFATGAAGKGGP